MTSEPVRPPAPSRSAPVRLQVAATVFLVVLLGAMGYGFSRKMGCDPAEARVKVAIFTASWLASGVALNVGLGKRRPAPFLLVPMIQIPRLLEATNPARPLVGAFVLGLVFSTLGGLIMGLVIRAIRALKDSTTGGGRPSLGPRRVRPSGVGGPESRDEWAAEPTYGGRRRHGR